MNYFKILRRKFEGGILFCILSTAISCHCDDMICPGLDPRYIAWLNDRPGDIIKYVNSNGNEIFFTVDQYSVLAEKTVPCHSIGYGGCKCSECERPSGNFNAGSADTSRKLMDSTGTTIRVFQSLKTVIVTSNDKTSLSYSIFDHSNTIDIGPELTLHPNDSLLPVFSIGTKNYTNVIVHQTDTTVIPTQNPMPFPYTFFVVKSYFCKEFGVVAFYDQLTQSLYYREY